MKKFILLLALSGCMTPAVKYPIVITKGVVKSIEYRSGRVNQVAYTVLILEDGTHMVLENTTNFVLEVMLKLPRNKSI